LGTTENERRIFLPANRPADPGFAAARSDAGENRFEYRARRGVGVFPGIGWTTALCAIAALVLRLNLPAIQIVNYFMYPAQIALLIPFFRIGEKLFRAPHLPVSPPQLQALIRAGVWQAIRLLWTTTWHAMVAWLLIAPVLVATIYVILVPLLRRALRREAPQSADSP